MLDYGLEVGVLKYLVQDSNLSVKDSIQRVEHKQEVPEYQNTYSIFIG